jgi:hypothetical protein
MIGVSFMLTVEQLKDIRFELKNALQFMNDVKEQFTGYEEEQFGENDITGDIQRKEEMIVLIENTISEMQNEDTAMWDMLIEFLDSCGDSGEAHFIKDKMKDVEVNDFDRLKESLETEEQTFLHEGLTEFLIEKDMSCEREEALIVTYLIDKFY